MTRPDLVLAALSMSGGAPWQPVQVQKLFFLLDERAAGLIGKHWNFRAYDYGPFDAAVYGEIDMLATRGLAEVHRQPVGPRTFLLTAPGQTQGEAAVRALPPAAQTYLRDLSVWIRSLSFQQLVSAIYRDYPAMRENSVFKS